MPVPATFRAPPNVVNPLATLRVVLPFKFTVWPEPTVMPPEFTRMPLLAVSKPLKLMTPVTFNTPAFKVPVTVALLLTCKAPLMVAVELACRFPFKTAPA